MRKPINIIAGVLFAASLPALAQPGGGQMPPTLVETVKPTVGTVVDDVAAVGSLRAAESVVMRPEFAGRIEKIHFEEGQMVAAGDPMFTVDSSLIGSEVKEWEAMVAQSRRESARAKELVEKKLLAQNDLDTKTSQLAVNEARLASARTRLAKSTLRAPFTGLAGLREVSPGAYVEAGAALVSLTQVDPIKLDFRIPEAHLAKVAVGQPVSVTVDAFPGRTFNGTVQAIDPQLDPQGRSLVLRAGVENAKAELRPGLFARVTLALATHEGALAVPEQALWPMGGKQHVYVVKAGKAELVEVQTGLRRKGMVEIKSGLTPDSVVITAGQIKIGPGAPVQVAGAAPKPKTAAK